MPLAVFEDPQWMVGWGAIAFTLGLLVGSFLNVVIYRLPRGESVVHPGSHCPHCQAAIRPWENVPVLSYLWLRGRCRQCSAPISARYPAIEFLTGCVFLALTLRFGVQAETPLFLVFAALLITAAWIDLDYQIIPDGLSLGGLAVGLGIDAARQDGRRGCRVLRRRIFQWRGCTIGGRPAVECRFYSRAPERPLWVAASSIGPAKERRCRAREVSITGRGFRGWALAMSN